ncbi:MAG: type II toxin-antitoxin system Phd/YefM family antitoxin [Patescibacteria group bacterium]|nr:type II toxin-antitoxin system Phd/YefM family antitoxin [Patescibacteria group bacterium]
MNKIIGLKELRENIGTYITEVGKGKSFTIVRKSKPVFKMMPVDEWGDEGIWETIADFTDNPRGGIPPNELLLALRKSLKNK